MTESETDLPPPVATPAAELVAEPAAEPAPAAPPDDTAALLRTVCERLDLLDAKFDDKVRDDSAREAIVGRLHAEVQQYKSDLMHQMLKPILLDLISLYDNLGKALGAAEGEAGEAGRQLRQRLGEVRTEVEDTLAKHGVEKFVVEVDAFDPRRQQPVKTLPAPSPEQVGKVAERLRPGFTRDQRVLRPERVSVFVQPTARP